MNNVKKEYTRARYIADALKTNAKREMDSAEMERTGRRMVVWGALLVVLVAILEKVIANL